MLLLCFLHLITDNDSDKKLFITNFLRCKNKRKDLHIPLIGIYAGTWMQEVTKAGSVLLHIYPEDVLSQQPKSSSSKKARAAVNLIECFHENEEGHWHHTLRFTQG